MSDARDTGHDEAHHAEVEATGGRRTRIAVWLTLVTMATYFGFILLVAFDKPLLGRQLAPGLSVGIALGAAVIVTAWVLTAAGGQSMSAHRPAAARGACANALQTSPLYA